MFDLTGKKALVTGATVILRPIQEANRAAETQLRLEALLRAQGAEVHLTRTTDAGPSNHERADGINASGAEVLVTSCPYCISNLEESRLGLPDDDPLQIKDVIEVVAESLEDSLEGGEG